VRWSPAVEPFLRRLIGEKENIGIAVRTTMPRRERRDTGQIETGGVILNLVIKRPRRH